MAGRYTPIRRLGSGGMGDVFLGLELGEDGASRRIALKRIRADLASDDRLRELVVAEAGDAARLTHPNIVQIYQVGSNGADLYIAMEHVEGRTLHDLLQQAARLGIDVPIEVVMAIGLDVARGLHHAHEIRGDDGAQLGLVHRGLSPKNVMVTVDGTAKIVDFGISSASIALGNETPEIEVNPGYLSPEQARAEPTDRRSDVFTLGVLLWELTCGHKLFKVRDATEAREVIGRARIPSPTEVRAVPPGWEGVLRRALAEDPGDRYATARALQLDIEEVARSAGYMLSNLPVVATLATLFPEVSLEVESASPPARRPTVLVVDDEPHMIDLLTRTLRKSFDVRSASSIAAAKRSLAAGPCDMVITDERMPEGRGLDLLAHVARTSPRTVRVMITAHADPELVMAAINDGRVHRFAVKPIRPADLLSLAEDAIGRGHASSPMPALPWESLRHLAAPVRDDALSCMLLVAIAGQPLGEDDRAAIEWALGRRLEDFWVHVEGREVAMLLPGVSASGAITLAGELRTVASGAVGSPVGLAQSEILAGDDLVETGRRVEAAALRAWREENGREH